MDRTSWKPKIYKATESVDYKAEEEGTSDGAKKGWLTRQRGGSAEEPKKDFVPIDWAGTVGSQQTEEHQDMASDLMDFGMMLEKEYGWDEDEIVKNIVERYGTNEFPQPVLEILEDENYTSLFKFVSGTNPNPETGHGGSTAKIPEPTPEPTPEPETQSSRDKEFYDQSTQNTLDTLNQSKVNGFPFFSYVGKPKQVISDGKGGIILYGMKRNPNSIRRVDVKYDEGRDTYTVSFMSNRNKPKGEYNDVYFDQLSGLIAGNKGLGVESYAKENIDTVDDYFDYVDEEPDERKCEFCGAKITSLFNKKYMIDHVNSVHDAGLNPTDGQKLNKTFPSWGESYATEDDYKYDWDQLTSLAQKALSDIGYDKKSWNQEPEDIRKEMEKVAYSEENWKEVANKFYKEELNKGKKNGGEAMYGYGSATGRMSPVEAWNQGADVYGDMGYDQSLRNPIFTDFRGLQWNELPTDIQEAWKSELGYYTQGEGLVDNIEKQLNRFGVNLDRDPEQIEESKASETEYAMGDYTDWFMLWDEHEENVNPDTMECDYCFDQFNVEDKQGMINHINSKHDANVDPVTGDTNKSWGESKANEDDVPEDYWEYRDQGDPPDDWTGWYKCRTCGKSGMNDMQHVDHANNNPTHELQWTNSTEESKASEADPCWKGYKQIGMKDKNGKQVPNCVPESNESVLEKVHVDGWEFSVIDDGYGGGSFGSTPNAGLLEVGIFAPKSGSKTMIGDSAIKGWLTPEEVDDLKRTFEVDPVMAYRRIGGDWEEDWQKGLEAKASESYLVEWGYDLDYDFAEIDNLEDAKQKAIDKGGNVYLDNTLVYSVIPSKKIDPDNDKSSFITANHLMNVESKANEYECESCGGEYSNCPHCGHAMHDYEWEDSNDVCDSCEKGKYDESLSNESKLKANEEGVNDWWDRVTTDGGDLDMQFRGTHFNELPLHQQNHYFNLYMEELGNDKYGNHMALYDTQPDSYSSSDLWKDDPSLGNKDQYYTGWKINEPTVDSFDHLEISGLNGSTRDNDMSPFFSHITESKANEDYGDWNKIKTDPFTSNIIHSSSFNSFLKEIGAYHRWETMTENEKIYIYQFFNRLEEGQVTVSDYKPYSYESKASEDYWADDPVLDKHFTRRTDEDGVQMTVCNICGQGFDFDDSSMIHHVSKWHPEVEESITNEGFNQGLYGYVDAKCKTCGIEFDSIPDMDDHYAMNSDHISNLNDLDSDIPNSD